MRASKGQPDSVVHEVKEGHRPGFYATICNGRSTEMVRDDKAEVTCERCRVKLRHQARLVSRHDTYAVYRDFDLGSSDDHKAYVLHHYNTAALRITKDMLRTLLEAIEKDEQAH